MLGCRPELTSDVPAVPPILTNGPDDDVELNMVYHVALAEAVHDMVIELDDFGVAVTLVGAAGGGGCSVVADAVLDGTLVSTSVMADIL